MHVRDYDSEHESSNREKVEVVSCYEQRTPDVYILKFPYHFALKSVASVAFRSVSEST